MKGLMGFINEKVHNMTCPFPCTSLTTGYLTPIRLYTPFIECIFPSDNDFSFAVLHEENERPAVTVYTLNKSPTTYYFPEGNRLVKTCTTPTRLCPDIHLDIIFRGHNEENAVIIAKLVDAIGFMELRNYASITQEIQPIVEVLSISQVGQISPCDPLDIVRINGEWTIYCIQSNYLFYCDLRLNFTRYSSSQLRCRYLNGIMIQQVSDFLLTPSGDYVYFINGGTLYRITPANDDLRQFASLEGYSCRHLDYVQSDLLLYCSSGVSLKIDSDRIARTRLINETGIAFACHQSDQFFTVRQTPVNTELHITNQSISLGQSTFVDTKCILFESIPLIVVLDAVSGVTILREDLVEVAQVPAGCSMVNPCQRLVAYANPTGIVIVVFTEGGQVEALLFNRMFHLYDTIIIDGTFAGLVPLFPLRIGNTTGSGSSEGGNDKSVSFGTSELIATITSGAILAIVVVMPILVVPM